MSEPGATEPLEAALARAASAEALAAELGLALDVLGRLVGVASEEAVADIVLECAQVLFGAGRTRLTLLDRHGDPTRAFERGLDGRLREEPVSPRAPVGSDVVVTEDLIEVPVTLDGRHLAVLVVSELFAPADRFRYTPTIYTVARVAAMALANVRAVKGLVPICASCKKIRVAPDAWQDLEAYIAAHSEAELSHGLCPGCYRAALVEAGLDPDDERPLAGGRVEAGGLRGG